MPTILGYLRLPLPEGIRGENLGPVLEEEVKIDELSALSALKNQWGTLYALSTLTRKFIVLRTHRGEDGYRALYDLSADPEETAPLRSEKAVKEMAAARSALSAVLKEDGRIKKRISREPGNEIELPDMLKESLKGLGYLK